jgi:hypothetical protein
MWAFLLVPLPARNSSVLKKEGMGLRPMRRKHRSRGRHPRDPSSSGHGYLEYLRYGIHLRVVIPQTQFDGVGRSFVL